MRKKARYAVNTEELCRHCVQYDVILLNCFVLANMHFCRKTDFQSMFLNMQKKLSLRFFERLQKRIVNWSNDKEQSDNNIGRKRVKITILVRMKRLE